MKILIKNGIIYDGTLETAPFTGDLLISGDRIQAIAPISTVRTPKSLTPVTGL